MQNYHKHLRAFFNWLLNEEVISESPMERISVPVARSNQIQPFTPEQVRAILDAARHSKHKRRDEALVALLLDSGVRVSEACGLRVKDIDWHNHRCTVLGKGNKTRTAPLGRSSSRLLWQYLKEERRGPDEPLFLSDRGQRTGEALTRNGMFQLIQRLGQRAGLEAIRCSPHTFRHTFAVMFLRAGGNSFTLKEILGHTSLHITNRYVALAQADIDNQHRQFSPMNIICSNRK